MKNFWRILILSSALLVSGATGAVSARTEQADESAVAPEKSGIDVQKIIDDHLKDNYSWHIATVSGRHVAIPLLCILRDKEGHWSFFSSERITEGGTWKGFYIAADGKWKGKVVARDSSGAEYRPLDLSFTKNAAALVINSLLMIVIFLSAAGWYKRHDGKPYSVPHGFVGAIEMLTMSIQEEVIHKSIGVDYQRYSPYLLTAFYFIFINNLMGLLPTFPGGANTTGNIAVTLVLALCTMIAINLFGNKEYRKDILWPDVPIWMKVPIPLMPIIELFGVISKPFALTIRLFANIMAGHTILIALTCMIFLSVSMGAAMNAGMTVFSVLLSAFMMFLELLVAFIQAYVFTMLSAAFIGLSRKHHETEKRTTELKTK